MRVLLTGANGFVGSHILDRLVAHECQVAIMLRRTSDTRFIQGQLCRVEVRYGTLESVRSLRAAMEGASVVVHCAGKTKAVRRREYYAVNAEGAGNVVAACNASADTVSRLVLISSLAVSGPGTAERPAVEDASPRPVSVYGESKMLGERRVLQESRVPYTILRPAAVYGPRDRDLYLAFRAVSRGWMPLVAGGRAGLSLVYARDVAQAVVVCMERQEARGGIYHVAHPVPWTQRTFLAQIARELAVRPRRLRVPGAALYPVSLAQEVWARITGKPTVLNLQKIPEYTAPGWVCSTDRAARELGFMAQTDLEEGVRKTVDWYRSEGWL